MCQACIEHVIGQTLTVNAVAHDWDTKQIIEGTAMFLTKLVASLGEHPDERKELLENIHEEMLRTVEAAEQALSQSKAFAECQHAAGRA